jgi:hypothetical protein
MKSYLYIHTISYYDGNNREGNIQEVINRLSHFNLSATQTNIDCNLLIVYILYDQLSDVLFNKYNQYKEQQNDNLDIIVLFRYNTGGTVQTMDYTYTYLINNKITSKFIGVYEDDAIFKKQLFLDDVFKYLNDGYIMTGPLFCKEQHITFKCFYEPYDLRTSIVPWCRKFHIYENDKSDVLIHDSLYKWVDGCGYTTTIENIGLMKEKLNKLTLAPENERYSHCEHGINYGEVGFCTRLHINGFKFIGMPADIYYDQLDQQSVGNKYN